MTYLGNYFLDKRTINSYLKWFFSEPNISGSEKNVIETRGFLIMTSDNLSFDT